MESCKKEKRVYEVLIEVTSIPKQLVLLHGLENLTEFLLHNLCQQNCFNISKAALFIDNPDFNHLQGIAGFHKNESYQSQENHWREPEQFSTHMKQAQFNSKVRDMCRCSIKANKKSEAEVVKELSQELDFSNPNYMVWPVKYENRGLLMFEKTEQDGVEEYLHDALHLFGFCPIF